MTNIRLSRFQPVGMKRVSISSKTILATVKVIRSLTLGTMVGVLVGTIVRTTVK
uniref:Uncharacterized protein n=1 Tax=Amphimedon queenslandica TaxID=400682 RepID=A0A1X7UL44_AMPQE